MADTTKVVHLAFEKDGINLALLHEELEAALGETFLGLSRTGDKALTVHLRPDITPDAQERIAPVITLHDADRLTAAQQAEQDRAAFLADSFHKPWSEWTVADKDRLLHALAARLGLLNPGS
ncbi:MAG: hypothetical protein GYB65_14935 [Chloroflexi bacterium]|nr:hypothetical protein [Chloroflexota bacterium]